MGNDYIDYTRIGEAAVSTIRLPASYGHSVAETVVFRGPLHNKTQRYESVREAEAGHAAWTDRVRAVLDDTKEA